MKEEHKHHPVLLLGIVKEGQGSLFLKICKLNGATGGTVLRAQGTVVHPILNLLGLQDSKKELLFTIIPKVLEMQMSQALEDALHLSKKGQGVLFTLNTSSLIGNSGRDYLFKECEKQMRSHQLIITIVDRELGDDVVEAGRTAGADGATILHGRGTGSREVSKLFNVNIEPEKEVVLMVVDSEKVKTISEAISEALDIRSAGKGLLFTIPINQATGLFESENEE